jgi:hypothetical protein
MATLGCAVPGRGGLDAVVDDIAVMVNEFCRVVVALERELAAAGRADEPSARPLETLDVAVLAGLDLLGPMRRASSPRSPTSPPAAHPVGLRSAHRSRRPVAGEVYGDCRVEVVTIGADQVRG